MTKVANLDGLVSGSTVSTAFSGAVQPSAPGNGLQTPGRGLNSRHRLQAEQGLRAARTQPLQVWPRNGHGALTAATLDCRGVAAPERGTQLARLGPKKSMSSCVTRSASS